MNKYKVQFIQREKYIVDVYAESEEKAREIAEEEWNNGNYEETGDIEVEVDMVFDVTGTDDPFSPVNEEIVCGVEDCNEKVQENCRYCEAHEKEWRDTVNEEHYCYKGEHKVYGNGNVDLLEDNRTICHDCKNS